MENNFLDFITNGQLYSRFKIDSADKLIEILAICRREHRYEKYCHECDSSKVFIYDHGISSELISSIKDTLTVGPFTSEPFTDGNMYVIGEFSEYLFLRFSCSMNSNHKNDFFFTVEGEDIIKVGQYPSLATSELTKNKSYTKILGKEYSKEFNTALGLFSHGIGIGSFVYLRRIIEKLVDDASKEAIKKGKITQEEYVGVNGKNTMTDKIKVLHDFLPAVMTNNPQIYGIVSKGIHELSEDECMKYFPIIKMGIETILDVIIAEKEKQKSTKEFEHQLNIIHSELNQKSK